MKKIITILSVVLFATACSKDDDNGSSKKAVPVTITLVSANDTFNEIVHLTYDSKRRVSGIDLGGGESYSFHYANDKEIAQIDYVDGGTTNTTIVTYDSQGRIIKLADTDTETPITYFDDGSYSVYGLAFANNSAGDLSKYSIGTFTYNTAKKGAFANVAAVNPFLMSLVDPAGFFYATHKPVTALTTGDNSFTYSLQNTYNDKGYIVNSVVTGSADATISYEYEDM